MATLVTIDVLRPGSDESERLLAALQRQMNWGQKLQPDRDNAVEFFFLADDSWQGVARVKEGLDAATRETGVEWYGHFDLRDVEGDSSVEAG